VLAKTCSPSPGLPPRLIQGPDAGKQMKPTPPQVSDLRSVNGRLSGACPVCNHDSFVPPGGSGSPIRCRGSRSLFVVTGKQLVALGLPESNSRLDQARDQGQCATGEQASSPVMSGRTSVRDEIDGLPTNVWQGESSSPVMLYPGSVSRRRSTGVTSVLVSIILGVVCAQGIPSWFCRHAPLRVGRHAVARARWMAPSDLGR
jgi:hypothetical protein